MTLIAATDGLHLNLEKLADFNRAEDSRTLATDSLLPQPTLTKDFTMWDQEGFLSDIEELQNKRQQPTTTKKRTTTMSFSSLSDAFKNTVEEHPVKGGEYRVRIAFVACDTEKGYIRPAFEVVDDPYSKLISDFLNLPGKGRNPREENSNMSRLGAFFSAFGLDPDSHNPLAPGFDSSAQYPIGMAGAEGWIIVGDPVDKQDGYGPQNRVNKYMPQR